MAEPHQTALDIPYAAPTLGDVIEETFANLQVTPNDDPALAYRLGVPKQWAVSRHFGPVVEELLIPEGVGFFAGSLEPGSPVIAVTLTRFPFEMPVDAWVRHTLAEQGSRAAIYGGQTACFSMPSRSASRGRGRVVGWLRGRGRSTKMAPTPTSPCG